MNELDDKHLYIQIVSGDNIGDLEEAVQNTYKKLRSKFETVVLPSPLTVRDYKKMQDILKRNKIRKERRGRSKS